MRQDNGQGPDHQGSNMFCEDSRCYPVSGGEAMEDCQQSGNVLRKIALLAWRQGAQ